MSKIIMFTEDYLDQIKCEFNSALTKARLSDGKFQFTKVFASDEKAELVFSELAWIKMTTLIMSNSKEVAWHGVAYRDDDPTVNRYTIEDILVYPQKVSGAYVEDDDDKIQEWRDSLDDDTFTNLRCQGHSHVDMATSPSATDENLYKKFLDQLGPEDFYIFMIWNRKNDRMIRIYDMRKNILFETADCSIGMRDDGLGVVSFIHDSKELIAERVTPGVSFGSNNTSYSTKGTTHAAPSYSPVYTPPTPKYNGGNNWFGRSAWDDDDGYSDGEVVAVETQYTQTGFKQYAKPSREDDGK